MGYKLMILCILITHVTCQEGKPNIVLLFADDVRIYNKYNIIIFMLVQGYLTKAFDSFIKKLTQFIKVYLIKLK